MINFLACVKRKYTRRVIYSAKINYWCCVLRFFSFLTVCNKTTTRFSRMIRARAFLYDGNISKRLEWRRTSIVTRGRRGRNTLFRFSNSWIIATVDTAQSLLFLDARHSRVVQFLLPFVVASGASRRLPSQHGTFFFIRKTTPYKSADYYGGTSRKCISLRGIIYIALSSH